MLTSFSGNLFCALETGHVIVIGGRSIDSASSINLNLSTGKASPANIALHISVRFHEDVIVRNTRIEGTWGTEEREDNLHEFAQPNPLIAGKIKLKFNTPLISISDVVVVMDYNYTVGGKY